MSSRPLKTLLFSTLYPSSARPHHGIFVETRQRELMQRHDITTKVVAPVPWFPFTGERFGDYGRMARTPRHEVRNGLEVWHPRYPLLPKMGMTMAPFSLALSCLGPIRQIIRDGFDFDVIDAHYYFPDGVAAVWLAKQLGKPVCITARGTDLNLIPRHAIPRRMIAWAAREAQASIGVCGALMDVLREMGMPDDRLHVLRNGVDLDRFSPIEQGVARAQLNQAGSPLLLSVGHLIERKGHHLIIEAMPYILRQQPGARLLIIGDGEMRSHLTRQVEALALQNAVQLVGAIPNAELKHWYSAADALILASSREGWANVLLEAMACGTPVVATRIWGTPEVVTTEDVGELVDRREPQALADGVCRLISRRLSRHKIRQYAEGFGWATTNEGQYRLFSSLIMS